jgi:flagellar motor component MotA|tara:strand:+ start:363 stop:611 length:249 start_codon:yes stop_codon:yes gene_type:complete
MNQTVTTINYFVAHCLYVNKQETEKVLIKIPTCSYTRKDYNAAMKKLREYADSNDKESICNIETILGPSEYELLKNYLKVLT